MITISTRNASLALLLAFSLALSMPAVHASTVNLAVDLISTSFSDTSVQATASGPSGTGSVVLSNNPGGLNGFDITIDATGSVSLTTLASVNPGLCSGGQITATNSLVLNTIHIAVVCLPGGTIFSGDQNLFQFGWSGSSGTVDISSSTLTGFVGGSVGSVSATTSNATVTSSSSVPEFPVGFALLFAVMVPTILLLRNVRIKK